MNAQELRIGNKINVFRKPQDKEMTESTVIEIFIDNDEYFCRLDDGFVVNISKGIKPIPLTEERLLRFGFEKKGSVYILSLIERFATLCIEPEDMSYCIYDNVFNYKKGIYPVFKTLEYVHQLQNLVFALTEEELKPIK